MASSVYKVILIKWTTNFDEPAWRVAVFIIMTFTCKVFAYLPRVLTSIKREDCGFILKYDQLYGRLVPRSELMMGWLYDLQGPKQKADFLLAVPLIVVLNA